MACGAESRQTVISPVPRLHRRPSQRRISLVPRGPRLRPPPWKAQANPHVRLGPTFPRDAGPTARRSTQSPCPARGAADEGPSPREHTRAAHLPSAGVIDAGVLGDARPHTRRREADQPRRHALCARVALRRHGLWTRQCGYGRIPQPSRSRRTRGSAGTADTFSPPSGIVSGKPVKGHGRLLIRRRV